MGSWSGRVQPKKSSQSPKARPLNLLLWRVSSISWPVARTLQEHPVSSFEPKGFFHWTRYLLFPCCLSIPMLSEAEAGTFKSTTIGIQQERQFNH